MKIIVDGYGGDNAPFEIVKGCVMGAKEIPDIEIVITGKETELQNCLKELGYTGDKIKIVNADSVISCDDENPAMMIRKMPDSSLVVALDLLKQDKEATALISAGSTGAVLSGALLKIGRIKGISRPALALTLPTKIEDKNVLLLDCGANADCKPINMAHFAIMGSIYFSKIYGVEKPRVALLNVGVEDSKGNIATKQAFDILKTLPINFVGNMEARELASGDYDVVVADGFSGNIALKSIEGTASLVMGKIKGALKSSLFTKIGYVFMKKALNNALAPLDYHKLGGSQFLGCNKLVLKAHGNSKAGAIFATLRQASVASQNNVNEEIEKAVSVLELTE